MLRIEKVQPTVLFRSEGDHLVNVVDVAVENSSGSSVSGGRITFDFAGHQPVTRTVDPIPASGGTCRVEIPDIRDPVEVTARLQAGDEPPVAHAMTWKPRKHWRIHSVPLAHHDLGYTDTIENVLALYCGVYEDAIRFCEETADWPEESRFHYTAEGAWSLRHFVEQASPETVQKLANCIKQGKIEIPALIGNQTSVMCGHEELIRLMYPSFRLRRQLGGQIRAGSITDVPGLSWGIPTILGGAGVEYFFAGLPSYFSWGRNDVHEFWDQAAVVREHGVPDAFYWRGPDGKKVLVYYQVSYGCWSPLTCDAVLEELPPMLDAMDEQGNPFSVARYGGYGCGDNTPTSIVVSELARDWNERWAFPKLVVSTNTMFFEALEKQCTGLRTFSGELPDTDYTVGALSTARETTLNRLTHDQLPAAERFAAIASVDEAGVAQTEEIERAFTDMILFDEHTWGYRSPVGLKQDFAWHEKATYAYRAAAATDAIMEKGLASLAKSVQVAESGDHLVLFNPLAFERAEVARVEGLDRAEPFELVDMETGGKVPYQVVTIDDPLAPTHHAAGRWQMGRVYPSFRRELLFRAENMPPVGYRTFRMVPVESSPSFDCGLTVTDSSVENQYYRVTVDPSTGAVSSIHDKELSRELVDPDARHQANQLVVKKVPTGELATPASARITRGLEGPVGASLIVQSEAQGCPQVTQEIILYDAVKRVDFSNRVLKDYTPSMELYFAFPFDVPRPDMEFEGPCSVVTPFRDQFPGSNTNYYSVQHWARVTNEEVGVAFAPTESHIVEFGGLWPCYVSQAHHGVTPDDFGQEFIKESDVTRGHIYSFALDSNFRTNFQPVQQSDLLFRYSITSSGGDSTRQMAREFGWAVGNPLRAAKSEGAHQGTRPVSDSFCSLDQPNVILSALKRAEDGDGFIVRLIEADGAGTSVTVHLPFLEIAEAFRADLAEETDEPLPSEEHSVTVDLEPYGLATIRLRRSDGSGACA